MKKGLINSYNILFLIILISLIDPKDIFEDKTFFNENNEYNFYMKDTNVKISEEIKDQKYIKDSEAIINQGDNLVEVMGDAELNYIFLTYEVIPYYGQIKVSVNNGTDSYEINGYKSYFYIYQKEQLENYTRQLFIECKEGLKAENSSICVVRIRIFTENSFLENQEISFPLYRYISTNNTNNYNFKKLNEDAPLNLNIIIFSGDINFTYNINNVNNIKVNNISNKIFYLSSSSEFTLNIYGIEDSFYSIIPMNDETFIIGANYLLNINKDQPNKIYKLWDYFYYYEQEEVFYYLGFYPLINETNIDIDLINNMDLNKENIFNKGKNKFAQKIVSSKDYYSLNIKMDIDKTNKQDDEYFYTSIYQLDNITGISLINNFSQKFLFNGTYNKMTFSYPHTQKEYNINISLSLYEEEYEQKYSIEIFLNDKYYSSSIYELSKNITNISLNANNISDCFSNFNHICKIKLDFELINNTNNSILDIIILTEKIDSSENEEESEKKIPKFVSYILFFIGGSFILMILLILYILIKILKNKRESEDTINNSFEEEMEKRDNALIDNDE